MKESTAAFIAISTIAIFALIAYTMTSVSLRIEHWGNENCPRILESSASEIDWRDLRRCNGYR